MIFFDKDVYKEMWRTQSEIILHIISVAFVVVALIAWVTITTFVWNMFGPVWGIATLIFMPVIALFIAMYVSASRELTNKAKEALNR